MRASQTPSTACCVDIDPHKLCMHNRSSRLFGATVCRHHAIRVNHTEIRCIIDATALTALLRALSTNVVSDRGGVFWVDRRQRVVRGGWRISLIG